MSKEQKAMEESNKKDDSVKKSEFSAQGALSPPSQGALATSMQAAQEIPPQDPAVTKLKYRLYISH